MFVIIKLFSAPFFVSVHNVSVHNVFRSFSGPQGMPIGGAWARDVGRRVDDVLTITSGKPRTASRNERKQRRSRTTSAAARVAAWLKRYSVETNVTALLTDACGETIGKEWRSNNRDARDAPGLHVLPLRNEYLACVDAVWRRASAPTAPIRWSSGVALSSVALGMCKSVEAYGFWPFATDSTGQRVAYHYNDEDPAAVPRNQEGLQSHLHDWSTEFRLLNSTSEVRIHVGRCV